MEYFGLEVNHELLEGLYISNVKKAVRKRKALRSSLSPMMKPSEISQAVLDDVDVFTDFS